jgi:hypothetical protein
LPVSTIPKSKRGSAYQESFIQQLCKLRNDHAQLFSTGNVRLPPPQEHPHALHQLRYPLPVHLEVTLVLDPLRIPAPARPQLLTQRPLLLLPHRLPIQAQALHKRTPLAGVVRREADAKQHGLGARKPPPQVLGARERQPQDEVRVVVLLALGLHAAAAARAGAQRQVLVQQRLHVRRRLGGVLVAERARLELGEHAQPVDRPLLELLERDVRRGRHGVEVQPVLVLEVFVGGRGELFLAVVESGSTLGVYAGEVLADHDCGAALSLNFWSGCQVLEIGRCGASLKVEGETRSRRAVVD